MASHLFAPTASPIFRPGSIQQNYQIKVNRLAPEVIVNLRQDRNPASDPHARDLLRPAEIRYFQQNGRNAVIFIHGFNVKYGHFSPHLEISDWGYDILRNKSRSPRVIYAQGLATTFRDSRSIQQQYANWHAKYPDLFRDVDLENLNGSGAHAWYLAMEDNLNRATGRFDRTDYSKYARIIHLAWSGDVFVADYMKAETHANRAGFGLARLIEQLVTEGIAVNVIAHSLGNRVLLVAMNLLGQTNSKKDWIQNAFMWQPAVPDTALSNNPELDTSVLRNWNFIHAHRATRKIIVLYSNRDNVLGKHVDNASFKQDLADDDGSTEAWGGKVLGGAYHMATVYGVPGSKMVYSPWNSPALYAGNLINDNLPKIEKALQQEIAKDSNGLFTDHLIPQWPDKMLGPLGIWLYARRISREMGEDARKTIRALAKAEYEVKTPRPAMGYEGPDTRDRFIQEKIQKRELLIVDQKLWLSSHSGMKIPDAVLFKEVYVDRIMGAIRQSTGFGRY